MGPRVAKLVLLTAVIGGCSKLYDPGNLPKAADAMPDSPADLRPCEMTVTDVTPTTISEGMGAGGSRPALIVITGENLVAQNSIVTITPSAGETAAPMIQIDTAKIEIGARGNQLSVPITLPVDQNLDTGQMIKLDVKVEQDCPEGRVSGTVLAKLQLEGLDELTGTGIALEGATRRYSQIDVQSGTTPDPPGNTPIVLHSTSSVKIAFNIVLNANGLTGGPAGGMGGVGGTGLGGTGGTGTGPSPGLTSGAPGRFDSTDVGINTLANPNRSSGGAGGAGAVIGGQGGDGGGGGGSIQITAGGDLEVGAISARGAGGATGVAGGAAGGGGSGGVIVLRAGGTLKAGDLDVAGGGSGARGRARYDAGGVAMVSGGDLGANHLRGPMFAALPFAFREGKPEFAVAGKPLSTFKYFFTKPGGGVSSLSTSIFDDTGMSRVRPADALEPGANQLCLITETGTATSETRNCAYFAYLP